MTLHPGIIGFQKPKYFYSIDGKTNVKYDFQIVPTPSEETFFWQKNSKSKFLALCRQGLFFGVKYGIYQ